MSIDHITPPPQSSEGVARNQIHNAVSALRSARFSLSEARTALYVLNASRRQRERLRELADLARAVAELQERVRAMGET
jgi:hypothetical protein